MNSMWDVFSEHLDNSYIRQPGDSDVEEGAPQANEEIPFEKKDFRKKLMLSVWLRTKPPNFEEEWMAKLCPIGKRHLIVAYRKITTSYDKKGVKQETFYSSFPGGNTNAVNIHVFTVLDCIFDETVKCYFVLDVVAWNNLSFRQVGVEHRYQWLKSKFDEQVNGRRIFENNSDTHHTRQFYLIETFPVQDLYSHITCQYFPVPAEKKYYIRLDGILFFHRLTPYKRGINPFVCWLKPFMVPEVLQLDVAKNYPPPNNYTGMRNYLQQLRPQSQKPSKQKNRQGYKPSN
ncbi:hypothetical protein ILUMI_03594 [Ignelater luminosus]|uniref:Snurportin-1 n=1 Tax=Ignelater luminosus TaxID=2038154 RepID=A0A8K0DG98_IGNLU|nr:hypothetical protein ILUMI_03594 [Ignelater luminosus]